MSESTNFHGNPEREAAFRVLKTARLPSVLIELAFVSNEQDAKLLRSDEWRRKVADSIVSAVDNYFSSPLARLPM
jgi:N-acetylmuramoyl-L-alanine amidase